MVKVVEQINYMNIKQTSIMIAATALFAGVGSSIEAAGGYGTSNCQIIYGGGEVCQKTVSFTLDKKVQKPTKGGEFVDNLGINDEKFAPGATVNFQITVKNTGDTPIENIDVLDTLPDHLTWVSGGNNTGNQVSYTLQKLEPGQSHNGNISVKVADINNLPTDKNIICVTNNVRATQDGNVASDASQLCIEKGLKQKDGGPVVQQTPPLKQTPQTGPGMLSLAALIPAGALGFFLNRKAIR